MLLLLKKNFISLIRNKYVIWKKSSFFYYLADILTLLLKKLIYIWGEKMSKDFKEVLN